MKIYFKRLINHAPVVDFYTTLEVGPDRGSNYGLSDAEIMLRINKVWKGRQLKNKKWPEPTFQCVSCKRNISYNLSPFCNNCNSQDSES